jgi:hypothetical protein
MLNGLRFTLHLNLDILRGVAYPPLEVIASGELVDKGAEANPLHHSPHADMN